MASTATTTKNDTIKPSVEAENEQQEQQVSFAHVQLFVDRLEELSVYQALEQQLNAYHRTIQYLGNDAAGMAARQAVWQNLSSSGEQQQHPRHFVSHNQDIVRQLLIGFGFRITAASATKKASGARCRSVLVTSRDPKGAQFLVTTAGLKDEAKASVVDDGDEEDSLFSAATYNRFSAAHGGRMGIGVLAFYVENVEQVKERYEQLHPALVDSYHEFVKEGVKVLQVFAYYQLHEGKAASNNKGRVADQGTMLRFVEMIPSQNDNWNATNPDSLTRLHQCLGLEPVQAEHDGTDALYGSYPCYSDHWVSNVFSRTEFLDTLKDTLGFTPKVDFNAGVVAAGEAQIESTVTGNTSTALQQQVPTTMAGTGADGSDDKENQQQQALRDQSQVYLPINNALSSVGHVHGFLEDLGQGVQHVASRVENLVDFVQRTNDMRVATGEGFSFLNIPRSYYGVLTVRDLEQTAGVSTVCAKGIMNALQAHIEKDGAVDLSLERGDMESILREQLSNETSVLLEEYLGAKETILDTICRSRYRNLYSLLGNHVSEQTYLSTVRNQILVDIQGEDLLYQIFTCNILQRNAGDEAPFLEFIQRVCSECLDENGCPQRVKPGCGGFGIRNFLTLFLSIEVSKAMQEVSDARKAGDKERERYAQTMVDCFASQLNEANPILTEISDAMTEEGRFQDLLLSLKEKDSGTEKELLKRKQEAARKKSEGNAKLMECSSRYNERMKAIRQARAQSLAAQQI